MFVCSKPRMAILKNVHKFHSNDDIVNSMPSNSLHQCLFIIATARF